MNIIIDNREKDLIYYFKNKKNCSFENLELGDIAFKYNNKILILIERKKLDDLSKSIKDGRYKEQKKRMKEALHREVRKIYLIEGINMQKFKLSEKTFTSVIINTMIRDNFHVFRSKNIDETIKFIENIYDRLLKYNNIILNEINDCNEKEKYSYGSVCKVNKKKNVTPEICIINQYQQIPGISYTIAKLLYENIGSFKNIYTKYQTEEEIDILKNKIIELKFGKINRRIGKKLGEKIINYLY